MLLFELNHKFTISRGSKNSAEVITVSIKDSGFIGLGECVPYKRYGESIESVSKGKFFDIELSSNNCLSDIEKISKELLSNPVIENFKVVKK